MIRVGRCVHDKKGKITYPQYPGFNPVIVMTYSHSDYWPLSPYLLKDDRGRIMENLWQFSKCYKSVPKSVQRKSRYDKTIIWEHDEEIHLDDNDMITDEYKNWRKKGMENEHPVRYPVGFDYRNQCKFALMENTDGSINDVKLNYVQARKAIYLSLYCSMVKLKLQFKELQVRLANNENLLIIEVDGPHQESIEYYKNKYGVNDDFIEDNTMLVTEANINIMLNDDKHPFGHGYCLAMAVLNKDVEWNK